ncbi:MAG: hypothetical protein ACKO1U_05790 [Bacteroidota bacterium]
MYWTDRLHGSRIVERLLLRHSFVAACVVALWESTRLSIGNSVSFEPETLVLFFGGAAYYDLHVLSYDLRELQPAQLVKRFFPGWLLWGLVILYFLKDCSPVFLLTTSACLLLAAGYTLPILNAAGRGKRLREWPIVKLLVVGLAYAAMTVLVPMLDTETHPTALGLSLLFLQRTVFISCLCIPFEVRDQQKEHNRGVVSLMDYGNRPVRYFAVCSLLFTTLSMIFGYSRSLFSGDVLIAESVVNGITIIWVLKARASWPKWVFTYLVDGTMALPLLLIILLRLWR